MANTPKRQRGLGRGLSALMADIEQAVGDKGPSSSERRSDMLVPIENVHPNPDQPRRHFDVDELNTNSTGSLFLTLFLVDSGIV